jgi:hypothetical protein
MIKDLFTEKLNQEKLAQIVAKILGNMAHISETAAGLVT